MEPDKNRLLKQEFERCLKQCFSVNQEVTEIRHLSPTDGRNHDRHIKVLADNHWYGFKTYPEAERKDRVWEDHRKYAEQDNMIAYIAETIVGAPNACKLRQVRDIDQEPFKSWTVNITKWLPNSDTLNNLKAESISKLRNDGEQFFYEYGEWFAFGIAMGVQDRRIDQFVYSENLRKLAMIDMDYCFVKTEDHNNYNQPLALLIPIKPKKQEVYLKALGRGIDEMNSKLSDNHTKIKSRLEEATYSDLSKDWDPTPDKELGRSFVLSIRSCLNKSNSL